jgi:hypothetical protein
MPDPNRTVRYIKIVSALAGTGMVVIQMGLILGSLLAIKAGCAVVIFMMALAIWHLVKMY